MTRGGVPAERVTVPGVTELFLAVEGQPRSAVDQRMIAPDVMLFTSKPGQQGAPAVFREAMATNLPIVSLDVGDARDLLKALHPGAVVPLPPDYTGAGDNHPEALVAELADLLVEVLVEVLEDSRRSNGRDHGRGQAAVATRSW